MRSMNGAYLSAVTLALLLISAQGSLVRAEGCRSASDPFWNDFSGAGFDCEGGYHQPDHDRRSSSTSAASPQQAGASSGASSSSSSGSSSAEPQNEWISGKAKSKAESEVPGTFNEDGYYQCNSKKAVCEQDKQQIIDQCAGAEDQDKCRMEASSARVQAVADKYGIVTNSSFSGGGGGSGANNEGSMNGGRGEYSGNSSGSGATSSGGRTSTDNVSAAQQGLDNASVSLGMAMDKVNDAKVERDIANMGTDQTAKEKAQRELDMAKDEEARALRDLESAEQSLDAAKEAEAKAEREREQSKVDNADAARMNEVDAQNERDRESGRSGGNAADSAGKADPRGDHEPGGWI